MTNLTKEKTNIWKQEGKVFKANTPIIPLSAKDRDRSKTQTPMKTKHKLKRKRIQEELQAKAG